MVMDTSKYIKEDRQFLEDQTTCKKLGHDHSERNHRNSQQLLNKYKDQGMTDTCTGNTNHHKPRRCMNTETILLTQGPQNSLQTPSHHLLLQRPQAQIVNRFLRNYQDRVPSLVTNLTQVINLFIDLKTATSTPDPTSNLKLQPTQKLASKSCSNTYSNRACLIQQTSGVAVYPNTSANLFMSN